MTRGKLTGAARREAMQKSMAPRTGGVTAHGAQAMASGLKGVPLECTITKYYRTSVFEYPVSYSGEDVAHTVYAADGNRAAIVSDLPSYFERNSSPHHSIDVSVGYLVDDEYRKALAQTSSGDNANIPLFLVVEESMGTPATTLRGGECYGIPEVMNGQQIIVGGREGETTLLAIRTDDGPWPDPLTDPSAINVPNAVQVAVKCALDTTGHVAELCSVDCFVTDDGRAVYPLIPGMHGTLRVRAGVDAAGIAQGADSIASMVTAMMADSTEVLPELLDALVLGDSQQDEYLRLRYLRLWEALKEAKGHLDGGPTPYLTDHRNAIAHWRTAKIDYGRLQQLQRTAIRLLQKKYS